MKKLSRTELLNKAEDATNCVRVFVDRYELWEEIESRRRYSKITPNYESLGKKYYEAYLIAKDHGF